MGYSGAVHRDQWFDRIGTGCSKEVHQVKWFIMIQKENLGAVNLMKWFNIIWSKKLRAGLYRFGRWKDMHHSIHQIKNQVFPNRDGSIPVVELQNEMRWQCFNLRDHELYPTRMTTREISEIIEITVQGPCSTGNARRTLWLKSYGIQDFNNMNFHEICHVSSFQRRSRTISSKESLGEE